MYSAISNGGKTNGDDVVQIDCVSKRIVWKRPYGAGESAWKRFRWRTPLTYDAFYTCSQLVKTSTSIRYLVLLSGSSFVNIEPSIKDRRLWVGKSSVVRGEERRGKRSGRNPFVRNVFEERLSVFDVTYIKRILRRTNNMKTLIFGLVNKKFIYAGTHRLSLVCPVSRHRRHTDHTVYRLRYEHVKPCKHATNA